MKVKGWLDLFLFGPQGQLKDERHLENVITEVGDAHVADQMSDRDEGTMSHMAIGTGTTAAQASDTLLEAELADGRVPLSTKYQGAGADDNDVVYKAEWGAGTATGAITEAGLFNQGSLYGGTDGGVMMCRQVFAEINKGTDDTLTITWTITFGAS